MKPCRVVIFGRPGLGPPVVFAADVKDLEIRLTSSPAQFPDLPRQGVGITGELVGGGVTEIGLPDDCIDLLMGMDFGGGAL